MPCTLLADASCCSFGMWAACPHPSMHSSLASCRWPFAIKADGRGFIPPKGTEPYVAPIALELDEIRASSKVSINDAKNADALGFRRRGEIHGANGYLIDQFLHDGSVPNRCLLADQVAGSTSGSSKKSGKPSSPVAGADQC